MAVMESKSLVLIVALVLLVGAAADAQTLDDGCPISCGDVQIPYPFGVGISSTTGKNCSLGVAFGLTCNKSSNTLFWGNIPVTAMNITRGKVDMMLFVSKVCYDRESGSDQTTGNRPRFTINAPGFTISSDDNKFISVGCDTYGYLNSYYNNTEYSTGCLTRCYYNSMKIVDGDCSGIGCCQVDVPPGMRNISVQTFSFENFNRSLGFNNCSYSFVAKNGEYNFSKSHLEYLPDERIPVVFDWTVGGNINETCEDSESRGTNACKGNTNCVNSDTGYGYQCRCKDGYRGNPYHPNGCTDIDECKPDGNHTCMSVYNCLNTPGSYQCFCPKGQSGNGTKEQPCHKENALLKYVIGASAGFIALFVAISLMFLMYQKRKLNKLKEENEKSYGN